MTKKMVWFTIGATIVIIAAAAFVLVNNKKESTESAGTSQGASDTNDTPAPSGQIDRGDTSVSNGIYIDYQADTLAAAKGDKLLFFHAPWCPQCRAVDADIKATTLPDNLTIFKVDYDSNQALRQKYEVTLQTTFVKVNDAGEKIESFVAYDEPTFAAVKRELLE